MAPPLYRLLVFGQFRVLDSAGLELKFPAKSACALLAYLAVHKQSSVQRSVLAEKLWPESDPSAARTNLRTAIHRVKKAFGGLDVFLESDGQIGLDPSVIDTDVARAGRHHYQQLFASRPEEALLAMKEEWQILKFPLLSGWTDEWVEMERTYHSIRSADLGCELARLLEESGQPREALSVLRHLLEQEPHRVDALEQAIQIEFTLSGPERALELATEANGRLGADIGLELPSSVKKIVKAIKNGVYEPDPKAGLFQSRNELILLSRMFESNLHSNSTEALRMLSAECLKPVAWQHPQTTFAIIRRALEQTSGPTPERVELAVRAMPFASWMSEFDTGHKLAKFALEHLGEDSPFIGYVLVFDGFMHFEQRHYPLARATLERSLDIAKRYGRDQDEFNTMSALAGLDWHELKFDEAEEIYLELIEHSRGRPEPTLERLFVLSHANLCFLHAFNCQWEVSVRYGEEAQLLSNVGNTSIGTVSRAPLGIATLMCKDRARGIELLIDGIRSTLAHGLRRYHQLALDFAIVAMAACGETQWATCLFQAAAEHRGAISHLRSPAEALLLLRTTGLDSENYVPPKFNPLLGQSQGALSHWACDALSSLLTARSA